MRLYLSLRSSSALSWLNRTASRHFRPFTGADAGVSRCYSAQPFDAIQTLDEPQPTLHEPTTNGVVRGRKPQDRRSSCVTFDTLRELYLAKMPITMLTAYDFATARMVGMAGSTRAAGLVGPPGVDICLCGDSLAMANLGYSSTTELGLDELGYHLAAMRRGLDSLRREPFFRMPLLVADLPFGTFEASVEQGVQTAITLVRRARVDGVKIEGGAELVPLVARLTNFGIPVVGHVGLTPQRAAALGGFRVQGHNSLAKARQIIADALSLERAGCVALVLEAVPTELVAQLQPQLSIPTIGIGAGPATDGQVLVFSDLVGGLDAPTAKFVPNFSASLKPSVQVYPTWELGLGMINEYVERVRSRTFPEIDQHTYQMKPSVLRELEDNGW